MSIENVVNQALELTGTKRFVASLYDGTPQAQAALVSWSQTRDEVFTALRPIWAQQRETLVLETTALDTDQWAGWTYTYTLPVGCLVPLQVVPSLARFDWRPIYVPFTHTDAKLYANIWPALLVYIKAVNDPDQWESDFVDAFIRVLAPKLGAVLMESGDAQRSRDNSAGDNQQSAGRDRG